MSDANQQRLDEIRAQLRRIYGHKELSAKQKSSVAKLIREQVMIEFGGVEEFLNSQIFQVR